MKLLLMIILFTLMGCASPRVYSFEELNQMYANKEIDSTEYTDYFRKYLRSLTNEEFYAFEKRVPKLMEEAKEAQLAEDARLLDEWLKMDINGDGRITDDEEAQFDTSQVLKGGSVRMINK